MKNSADPSNINTAQKILLFHSILNTKLTFLYYILNYTLCDHDILCTMRLKLNNVLKFKIQKYFIKTWPPL